MKPINYTPTQTIVFNQNDQFDDNFSQYLKEILEYWVKTFPKCVIKIEKDTSDNTGKSALIFSKECKNDLYAALKPALDSKNTQISDTIDGYNVKYTSKTKEPEKKVEKKKDEVTTQITTKPAGSQLFRKLLEPIASTVAGAISTGVQLAHYEHDEEKQLIEEINRIKKLLK